MAFLLGPYRITNFGVTTEPTTSTPTTTPKPSLNRELCGLPLPNQGGWCVPSDLKRLEARLMIGHKVKNIRLFGFSDWFLCRRRSFNDHHLTESIETCKCRRLETPPCRLGPFLTAPLEGVAAPGVGGPD
jgi:hypothetical protein